MSGKPKAKRYKPYQIEAELQGHAYFVAPIECNNGHIALRRVTGKGECSECRRMYTQGKEERKRRNFNRGTIEQENAALKRLVRKLLTSSPP